MKVSWFVLLIVDVLGYTEDNKVGGCVVRLNWVMSNF